MKKFIALLTAGIMLTSMTACQKSENPVPVETAEPAGATLEVQLTNSCKSAPLTENEIWKNALMYPCGEDILLCYETETDKTYALYHTADDTLSPAENLQNQNFYLLGTAQNDGQIILFMQGYDENQESYRYQKLIYDNQMHLTSTEDVTEVWKDAGFLLSWLMDSTGTEYAAGESGAYVKKPEESPISVKASCQIPKLTIGRNDYVCLVEAGGIPMHLNPETLTFEKLNLKGLPQSGRNNNGYFNGSEEYDFLCTDETALYGVKVEESLKEVLVNWNDSDLNPCDRPILLPEHRYAVQTFHFSELSSQNLILTPRTQDELDSLELISIASAYQFNEDFTELVHAFNQQSDSCRLVLHAYDTEHADAGGEQLTKDLLSGTIPDILVLDYMDYMPLSNKGMFEDMRPYFRNDPDFHEEDYLMNFLDALSYKGHMERIAFRFDVELMMGKKKYLEDHDKLLVSDIPNLTLPEDMSIFYCYSGSQGILSSFCYSVFQKFVDYENASCSFDSQEFIDLLNMIQTTESSYTSDQLSVYAEDKALLYPAALWTLNSFQSTKQIYFHDEDITLTGFSADDSGNGGIISPRNCLAVSSESKYKQQAYEFIKFCMKEENFSVNEITCSNGFPVNRNALKKLFDFEMRDDEENKNYYIVQDVQYEIATPTQETADIVMTFLENIHSGQFRDSYVGAIIQEESGKFLAGDCSAEDAAKAIQNRVSIYLAEQN